MSSVKWRPFCRGPNMLMPGLSISLNKLTWAIDQTLIQVLVVYLTVVTRVRWSLLTNPRLYAERHWEQDERIYQIYPNIFFKRSINTPTNCSSITIKLWMNPAGNNTQQWMLTWFDKLSIGRNIRINKNSFILFAAYFENFCEIVLGYMVVISSQHRFR